DIPVLPENFHAFVLHFWLEVIDGNDLEQLCYFLCNVLTFNTIPWIIGQMLESRGHPEALKLAQAIGEMIGSTPAAQAYSEFKPNYFEFIVVYATARQLKNYKEVVYGTHYDK
ncbi:hypothetical protein H4R35_006842, partial [Dimargaris xerosporica]